MNINTDELNYEKLAHATFDTKEFLNPPTVNNSKNVSHNTSLETVVNQAKVRPPKSQGFMDVLDEAVKVFSSKPNIKPIFELQSQRYNDTQNDESFSALIDQNTELRDDNKILVHENDSLKEELEEKDSIIDKLHNKIHNLWITLKECEIRLSHTSELYAKEKKEKENAAIAFNRILSNFTKDDWNSVKFLHQNIKMLKKFSPVRIDPDSYKTYGRMRQEDIYFWKDSLNEQRDSFVNTSTFNGNQRTVHTNMSHLVTGPGDTTSTGMLNNESYDFNPKDMEEMNSMH
jgi:hypothetical protein